MRRMFCEPLEARWLLATITVTHLADNLDVDGQVTLREAMLAAETDTSVDGSVAGDGADLIVFDPSLSAEPIALRMVADNAFGPSAFHITTEVSIVGDGRVLERAEDASEFRLFSVSPEGKLELTDLMLTGGVSRGGDGGGTDGSQAGGGGGGAGMGGAIFNAGSLSLDQVTLQDHRAIGGEGAIGSGGVADRTGGGGGGGIGADGDSSNTSVGGNGGGLNGGAGGEPSQEFGTPGAPGGLGGGGGGGSWAASGADGGFGGGGGGAGSGAATGGDGGVGGGGGGASFGEQGSPGTGGFAGGDAAALDGGGGAGLGGAVFNDRGTVIISNTQLFSNTALGGQGAGDAGSGQGIGGAIFSFYGDVEIQQSTISQNSADHGGGIGAAAPGLDDGPGVLRLLSSTVWGNVASVNGGGLYGAPGGFLTSLTNTTLSGNTALGAGGIWNAALLELTSCTVSDNTSEAVGGIYNEVSGDVSVRNTIIAGNDTSELRGDVAGPFLSLGHNLIGDAIWASGFGEAGDLVGGVDGSVIDPQLGPLQSNDGPTLTHFLQPGSPAIDAGDNSNVTDLDQRGYPRIADGNADGDATVDIGAFEENPILIDNDLSPGVPGQFAFDVLPAGASRGGRGGISAQGNSILFSNEDVIYDYFHFVDVGRDGQAINLWDTNLLQPTRLIGDDAAASEGTFEGQNGTVGWRVESRMTEGVPSVVSTITLTGSEPLGDLRFISYLDEDVVEPGDDLLYMFGEPGDPDFRAFTLDDAERIGFGHRGVYQQGSGLENATYDGWAANQFSNLLEDIVGHGVEYTPAGNINTTNLPPLFDPALGLVYGPADVTTAFAWSVDPDATSATFTAILDFTPDTLSTLGGRKFEDVNGNGTTDLQEPFLPGWTIQLDLDSDGSVDATTVTDGDGGYEFRGVRPGTHTVSEVPLEPWVQTRPDAPGTYRVVVGDQLDLQSLDFGNSVPGSIHGFKYEDVDADGQYTLGSDTPLAGASFTLTGTDGQGSVVTRFSQSDALGRFEFDGLLPSVAGEGQATGYTITEALPNGHVPTTAVSVTVDLLSGQALVPVEGDAELDPDDPRREVLLGDELRFGNSVLGSIHGFKYEDVDADGQYTLGSDEPLADVTFALTGIDGRGNVITLTSQSDPSGRFEFDGLLPSVAGEGQATGYTVTETLPSGYVATTPESVMVDLLSGQALVSEEGNAELDPDDPREEVLLGDELRFGNSVRGSIHGFLFDDRDGNGVFDFNVDAPLANALFTLSGTDGQGNAVDRSITTDTHGKFLFSDLLPSVQAAGRGSGYLITYSLPNGQRSKTHLPVETVPGQRALAFRTDLFSRQELVAFDGDAALPAEDPRHEEPVMELRFGRYFAQETGLIAGFVTSADLDGDGHQDLVVANDYSDPLQYQSSLSLLFGEGQGGFTDPLPIQLPDYARPQAVVVGDVTGDQLADLVVASIGDPTRRPAGPPDPENPDRWPVDLDTNAILVYANTGESERGQMFAKDPLVLLGGADLDTACRSALDVNDTSRCDGPIRVTLADVNSDQQLDLITAGFRADSVTILLHPFTENSPIHLPVGRAPLAVRAADINGDNHVDLAVVNHDADSVSILLGRGDATFELAVDTVDVERPVDVLLAHLNGDDFLDLAITNFQLRAGPDESEVRIFFGRQDHTFPEIASQRISVSPGAQSLTASDLDGDSDIDLIVVSANAGTVSLLENTAQHTGDFHKVSEFTVAAIRDTFAQQSPQVVVVSDFDGDERADDFAVAHFTYGVTAYFNGFPSGTQALMLEPATNSAGPQSGLSADELLALDVDRDGSIVPLDALLIINDLNANETAKRSRSRRASKFYIDVTGDGFVSSIDALRVLNYLNGVNQHQVAQPPQADVDQLQQLAAAAAGIWGASSPGLAASDLLDRIELRVADLPGAQLAATSGRRITIDTDAAGAGWYVDPTPLDNHEFSPSRLLGDLQATTRGNTQRVDLLTVVLHELGHVLGYADDSKADESSLMRSHLAQGIRRLPAAAADILFQDAIL